MRRQSEHGDGQQHVELLLDRQRPVRARAGRRSCAAVRPGPTRSRASSCSRRYRRSRRRPACRPSPRRQQHDRRRRRQRRRPQPLDPPGPEAAEIDARRPVERDSRSRIDVTRNPEIVKNTDTPMNPPGNRPGSRTSHRRGTARRASRRSPAARRATRGDAAACVGAARSLVAWSRRPSTVRRGAVARGQRRAVSSTTPSSVHGWSHSKRTGPSRRSGTAGPARRRPPRCTGRRPRSRARSPPSSRWRAGERRRRRPRAATAPHIQPISNALADGGDDHGGDADHVVTPSRRGERPWPRRRARARRSSRRRSTIDERERGEHPDERGDERRRSATRCAVQVIVTVVGDRVGSMPPPVGVAVDEGRFTERSRRRCSRRPAGVVAPHRAPPSTPSGTATPRRCASP